MMKQLCFTVDLDRDVNDAIAGSTAAISLDRGSGISPRFSSSAEGTAILLDLLDDIGIKCTFFAEARCLKETGIGKTMSKHEVALHGLDHEDFSGSRTGIEFTEEEMRNILKEAIQIIKDETYTSPVGFRSPYMSPNPKMMWFLKECGIIYDSSMYEEISPTLKAYKSYFGPVEIPAVKGKDSTGKTITSYLWPMHEGKRKPSDFVDLGNQIMDGIFVLATHTWHMVESRSSGHMDKAWIEDNYQMVRDVITGLLDSGFKPVIAKDVATTFD